MLNKTTKPKKTNNNYKKILFNSYTSFSSFTFCGANCGVLVASVVATSSPSSSLSVTKNASGSAETPDSNGCHFFLSVAPFL